MTPVNVSIDGVPWLEEKELSVGEKISGSLGENYIGDEVIVVTGTGSQNKDEYSIAIVDLAYDDIPEPSRKVEISRENPDAHFGVGGIKVEAEYVGRTGPEK